MPGSFPFLFKSRVVLFEKFALRGIVQEHHVFVLVHSRHHNIVKGQMRAGIQRYDQGTAFFQVVFQIVPSSSERERSKSVLLKVPHHAGGINPVRRA